MTNTPRFKIGDTIYWVCDEDQRVHHAEVLYVNYAKVGGCYIDVNYEVEEEYDGSKRTLFIDDNDAMEEDLSVK